MFDGVKKYYREKAPKEEPKPAAPKAAPQEEAKEEQKKDQLDVVVEDPLSVWEGEPIQSCPDLCYLLMVTNTTQDPLLYSINFTAGNVETPANLLWPRQGLIGAVGPNETDKVVALLPKASAAASEMGLNELQKLVVSLEGKLDEKKKEEMDRQGA